MSELPIKVSVKEPASVTHKGSKIVHQGGEAPSFGPVRKPA